MYQQNGKYYWTNSWKSINLGGKILFRAKIAFMRLLKEDKFQKSTNKNECS
jgi:hypothetical protein